MEVCTIIQHVDDNCAANVLAFVCEIVRAAPAPEGGDAAAEALTQACIHHTSSQDTPAFVRALMAHADTILATENEADVEATFQGILCVIFSIVAQNGDAVAPLISEMITILSSNPTSNANKRLKILVNLLNLLPSAQDRYEVVLATFTFAGHCGLLPLIAQHSERVEDWCRVWQLDLIEQRRLYEVLSRVFGSSSDRKRAQHFLTKYLETFDSATDEELQSVRAVATQLAVTSIKSPIVEVQQRNRVLSLKAIQKLKSDPDTSALVELLQILCEKGLAEFGQFKSSHASTFERYGISEADSEKAVQLLSLCDILTDKQQVSYSLVATSLNVGVEEVEMWVVLAISEGLIDARMDQFNNTLDVSRCIRRAFGMAQWHELQHKLRIWQGSLASIVQTMNHMRLK